MNIRSILAVLLAIVLVAMCAWLPEIIGFFQDRGNQGDVAFSDVNPVFLTFTGENLQMSERLYILIQYTYTTPIPPSLAELTPEEAETVGKQMLSQLQSAGVLPDAFHPADPDYAVETRPVIMGVDSENGCIFWRVAMRWDNCCVVFQVEDSTGAVCNILYEEYRGQWRVQEDETPDLAALFLGQLGEEFAEFDRDYLLENASWCETWDRGISYQVMELFFEDSISGLLGLEVSLHEYGFKVAFF